MQSKNNYGTWILPLPWQVIGVLLTAGVLGFIAYALYNKLALPFLQPAYPWLVFLAVICFYSLDHLRDELKFGREKNIHQASLITNFLLASLSAVTGAFIFFQHLDLWEIRLLLLPIILTIFYVLLMTFFQNRLYGLKEVIIAAVVALVLLYPALKEKGFWAMGPELFMLLLVCLQNLLVFGYFEKEKDDFYGFSTLYKGFSESHARKFTLYALIFLGILMVVVFRFSAHNLYGVFVCNAAYLLMFFCANPLKKYRMYRFIADAILLFIAL